MKRNTLRQSRGDRAFDIINHIIIIVLMFFGRVGGLTLIFAAASGKRAYVSRLPKEKITVG